MATWLKRTGKGVAAGLRIVWESLVLLFRHPVLIVPMLSFWLIYAPTLYVMNRIVLPATRIPLADHVLIAFAILFLSFCIGLCALWQLELVEQLETGERLGVVRAFFRALFQGSIRALPVLLVFAAIWLILNIIANLIAAARKSVSRFRPGSWRARQAEDDADSLTATLHKILRMWLFLVLPAIAWEKRWAPSAMKRAFSVLRRGLASFATGFFATEAVVVVAALPLAIILGYLDRHGIEMPSWGNYLALGYVGFLVSLLLYLEQMFGAVLYLWFLKWERRTGGGGSSSITLTDVTQPSLLDDLPDLASLSSRR